MKYQPNKNVKSFHGVPRFGASDNIAVLFSDDGSAKDEYINGLIGFCMLVFLLCCVWACILLVLKRTYGLPKVGCAAGGEPIDISRLRGDGVRRWDRRRRMERSWAVQNVFLLCCLSIPAFSAVAINQGLDPLLKSMDEVSETASVFEEKTSRAIAIAKGMRDDSRQLGAFAKDMDISKLCPSHADSAWALSNGLTQITSNLFESIYKLGLFAGTNNTEKFIEFMGDVLGNSRNIQDATDKAIELDWIIRVFFLALNTITAFLGIAALLTKNKINHHPTQKMVAYVCLPLFMFVLVVFVVYTCGVASFAVMEADFCAGGRSQSPVGTLREFTYLQGYEEDSVMMKSLDYYSDRACKVQSPLYFVKNLNADVFDVLQKVDGIVNTLHVNSSALIGSECGTDIAPLKSTLSHVSLKLHSVSGNIRAMLTSTTCASIQPMLDDLSFGATCTDSINAMAWMFSSLLTIIIFGLIMVSTRAAMYNTIVLPSKKRRREKEFHQYKHFMRGCGYDTSDWAMDPLIEKTVTVKTGHDGSNDENDKSDVLATAQTLETDDETEIGTARLTPESDDGSRKFFGKEMNLRRYKDSPDSPDRSVSSQGHGSPADHSASQQFEECTSLEEAGDALSSIASFLEESSVYSLDSDDSSIVPPPGVMTMLALNLTNLVHQMTSPRSSGRPSIHPTEVGVFATPAPTLPSPIGMRQYHQKLASLFQHPLQYVCPLASVGCHNNESRESNVTVDVATSCLSNSFCKEVILSNPLQDASLREEVALSSGAHTALAKDTATSICLGGGVINI